MSTKPDLDTPEAIHTLVEAFYARLLDDPLMRPVFMETAGIRIEDHLPRIEAYWRKMLLGEKGGYTRNMVARHEAVHAHEALRPEHFERWGLYFHQTLDERFSGPMTDRAHELADRILANLQRWLLG
jgi:hemoglobin